MNKTETITSRNNKLITDTSKLRERKYRISENEFVFEGKKLLEEALSSGIDVINIFVTEKYLEKNPSLYDNEKTVVVSDSVMEKLSENKNPLGLVARCKAGKNVCIDGNTDNADFILCGIQDPGNVGTMIRTAKAFGVKKILLTRDCADVWSQKTIRSSMGAVFDTELVYVSDIISAVTSLKKSGKKVYAAALDKNATLLTQLEGNRKDWCFAVGNEGHGLDKEFIENCDGTVFIPMQSNSESLNVSAAATVLLWEKYSK